MICGWFSSSTTTSTIDDRRSHRLPWAIFSSSFFTLYLFYFKLQLHLVNDKSDDNRDDCHDGCLPAQWSQPQPWLKPPQPKITTITTTIDIFFSYYFYALLIYISSYDRNGLLLPPLQRLQRWLKTTHHHPSHSTHQNHQWLVPSKLLTSRRRPVINWLPSLLNHQLVKLPWVLWAAYYAVPILNEGTMNQGDPDYIVRLLFLLCNCLTNLYFSLCWVCTVILSIFLLIPLCLKKFLQDNVHS